MANTNSTAGRTGSRSAKMGGFATGILLPILLALVVSILYSGGGIGDVHRTPPQVYTDF